jgi:excisionase family DNA binding protein
MPLAVPPREAAALLSLGLTRTYTLMRTGELQSFHSGRACRITVQSIKDYVARQLAAGTAGVGVTLRGRK